MKVFLFILLLPTCALGHVDVCEKLTDSSGVTNKKTLPVGTKIKQVESWISDEFNKNKQDFPYLIIEVQPGTYTGGDGLLINETLIKKKGLCLTGTGAIFKRDSFSGTDNDRAIIKIQNVSNVVVKGFELVGAMVDDKSISPYGIAVRNHSDDTISNIRIENNLIHSLGKTYKGCSNNISCGQSHGIDVNALEKGIVGVHIKGNKLTNLRLGMSEAITIVHNVSDFTVTDNEVWNVDNIAIDIGGGTDDSPLQAKHGTISGNRVHDLVSQPYRNSAYPFVAGIYIDGGTGSNWEKNITVENNRVSNFGIGIAVGSENNHCDRGNVDVNDDICVSVLGQYIKIDHNVLLGNQVYGIGIGKDEFGENGHQNSKTWNVRITGNLVIGNVVSLTEKEYGQIHFGSLEKESLKSIEVRSNVITTSNNSGLLVSVAGSGTKKYLLPPVSFYANQFFVNGGSDRDVWKWGESEEKLRIYKKSELITLGTQSLKLPPGIDGADNIWKPL